MTRIVALVPMRHTSERVPGKNYRSFGGRPLYHHIVLSLLDTAEISEVVIDTDSPTIFEDAPRHFPDVRLLERPEKLRAGEIPMNEVLLNTTAQVEADLYLQTHSTNPLLTSTTISRAIQTFLDAQTDYDSLFSVTRLQLRLWDSDAKPLNHDPSILLRTQDLRPVYEENSCIYIFSREILVKRNNRMGTHPFMFEIDRFEAIDIDEEIDFLMAEALFNQQNGAS